MSHFIFISMLYIIICLDKPQHGTRLCAQNHISCVGFRVTHRIGFIASFRRILAFNILTNRHRLACPHQLIRPHPKLSSTINALASNYLENDLVAISTTGEKAPRLCSVRPDGSVYPLCQREDDVATDLFADSREFSNKVWNDVADEQVIGSYGEGWCVHANELQ